MPAISRIWARSALISAPGFSHSRKTGTRATDQRNWPTHPAVPPGTDDQNSTPARELEPPQPLLRSLDGGQHPCAKIGASDRRSLGRHSGCWGKGTELYQHAQVVPDCPSFRNAPLHEAVDENSVSGVGAAWDIETSEGTAGPLGLADAELDDEVVFGHNDRPEPAAAGVALSRREELPGALPAVALVRRQRVIDNVRTTELVEFAGIPTGSECFETTYHGLVLLSDVHRACLAKKSWQALASEATGGPADHIHAVGEVDPGD